jgi:hypothetical protein
MEMLEVIAKNSSGDLYSSLHSAGWRTLPGLSENYLI